MILSTYSKLNDEIRTYYNDELPTTLNMIHLIDTDRNYTFMNNDEVTIIFDNGGINHRNYSFECTGEEVQEYLIKILYIHLNIKKEFRIAGDIVLNAFLNVYPDSLKDYIDTGIDFFGQYSDVDTFAREFAVHNDIISDEYSNFLDTDKYLLKLIKNDEIIIAGDYYFIP